MSYSKIEDVYINGGLVASITANQAALDVREKRSGSFWVVWSAAAAVDATFKLQESPDGTNWRDISGAVVILNAAAGIGKIAISNVDAPIYRGVVTKNSETTAVITVRYYIKGDR